MYVLDVPQGSLMVFREGGGVKLGDSSEKRVLHLDKLVIEDKCSSRIQKSKPGGGGTVGQE